MTENDETPLNDDSTPEDGPSEEPYVQASNYVPKYVNENFSAIQRAMEMAGTVSRMRTAYDTVANSPVVQAMRSIHESNAQLTGMMTVNSPLLEAARALEQQQSTFLETGRAIASANAKTLETFKSINAIAPVTKFMITPPSAITAMLNARPTVYGAAELDAITRTHRDLTRSLASMNSSWHKGLLATTWNNALFMLPQLPRFYQPQDYLGGFGWGAMQAAVRATDQLHQLLRSWQDIFRTSTDSVLSFLAQFGYMAALRARDAVVHGDADAVAVFIKVWLHQEPTDERIEAVSAALLEEGWEIEPATVLTTIPKLARDQRRALRPVWETQLGGRKVGMFNQPIGPNGFTLGDLAIEYRSAEDLALEDTMHHAIKVVMDKLNPDERKVAQVYMLGDVDWLQAAEEAGHPRAFGRRVNRKLQREGKVYIQRHGGLEL